MENRIIVNGKLYKIVGETKTIDGSLMQEIEPLSDSDMLIDKIENIESKLNDIYSILQKMNKCVKEEPIKRRIVKDI